MLLGLRVGLLRLLRLRLGLLRLLGLSGLLLGLLLGLLRRRGCLLGCRALLRGLRGQLGSLRRLLLGRWLLRSLLGCRRGRRRGRVLSDRARTELGRSRGRDVSGLRVLLGRPGLSLRVPRRRQLQAEMGASVGVCRSLGSARAAVASVGHEVERSRVARSVPEREC